MKTSKVDTMPENKLLILSTQAESYRQYLDSQDLPELQYFSFTSLNEAEEHLTDTTIMLADPALAKEVLNKMPKLVWLQSTWAGVNSLIEDDLRQDYLLTGVKGIFGALMSEYVFGYVLGLERNTRFHQNQQSKRSWTQKQPGRLQDKTIGIMGTGSIGEHIASTAQHFDMRVLGLSNSGKAKENFEKCFSVEQLHDFLTSCDYVVCTLPDTPSTTGLLNAKSFEVMKSSAWLINIGRGPVVEEDALLEAIRTNTIAGAILDVFVEEPLVETHPFWTQDNIIVTPHISAPSFPEDVAQIFVDNYNRFVNKESLQYQIDFAKGY